MRTTLKHNVEGVDVVMLQNTEITYNSGTDEVWIAYMTKSDCLTVVLKSIGSGCGDDRLLRESDDTVTDVDEIINYLIDYDNLPGHLQFYNHAVDDLIEWLKTEAIAKDDDNDN